MKFAKPILAAALIAAASPATADVRREAFGQLATGEAVEALTLENGHGVRATVITYGATLQAMVVPDKTGELSDVTLGFDSIDGYLANGGYLGATVGRVANRIAGGRFTLDGETHQTAINERGNALHGGPAGFDKVLWKIVRIEDGPSPSVTMRHVSPHLDQGYPGTLTVDATYALDENNTLTIEYVATTDRPTVANITNHAYWNLAGEGAEGNAMGHVLTIPADEYMPVDSELIPTGEFRPVKDTPLDFRKPAVIGARVRDTSDPQMVIGNGYDHNWVVDRRTSAEPRLLARLEEPVSGRIMEVISNQPGLQFYSGNFLNSAIPGKSGKLYRPGDAVALEPQMPPDTPNRPEFGSVRLGPGETYRHVIEFRFSTADP